MFLSYVGFEKELLDLPPLGSVLGTSVQQIGQLFLHERAVFTLTNEIGVYFTRIHVG